MLPVDEYTFTIPRQQQQQQQPPQQQQQQPITMAALQFHQQQQQQQQAFFNNQQCLPEPGISANHNSDWGPYHHNQPQLVMSMEDAADQAPPTPPPRLASAMNTIQFNRTPKMPGMPVVTATTLALDNTPWQVGVIVLLHSCCVDGG